LHVHLSKKVFYIEVPKKGVKTDYLCPSVATLLWEDVSVKQNDCYPKASGPVIRTAAQQQK
jgi:hypothetical protein